MLTFKYDSIGQGPECQLVRGFIPTNGVYESSYSAETTAAFSSAAAGAVLNARAIKPESATARVFVGSATKIEELTSGAITDRSKSGGYSGVTNWSFSQGLAASEIVAASIGYKIQKSTGGGFSDLTNAPKATVVLAQSRALLALNYIDDSATVPNGIKITTRGDSTVWDAAEGNEATAIKLVETPGEIYAGATLNDLVIVWKRHSMYLGRFVGGSEKWQFNLLSPYIGCFGPEAWAATPAGIIFAGPAGVYLFDGSVPREVDTGVRQLILNDIGTNNSFGYKVQMSHDEYSGCVFLWIPDVSVAELFRAYAYNYREGRWSIAYPMYDKTNNVYYDYGQSSPTDFQAVVRDLTTFDYNKITSSNLLYVGHFIVAGDKKVYNLSNYSDALVGDPYKYCSQLKTGRIRIEAPPDMDLLLRRVYPVFGSGRLFSGLPDGAIDTLKCQVDAFDTNSLARDTADSTTTVAFDKAAQRFDVFLTGKVFDVEIYSEPGTQFGLTDVRFDIVPVGKT